MDSNKFNLPWIFEDEHRGPMPIGELIPARLWGVNHDGTPVLIAEFIGPVNPLVVKLILSAAWYLETEGLKE